MRAKPLQETMMLYICDEYHLHFRLTGRDGTVFTADSWPEMIAAAREQQIGIAEIVHTDRLPDGRDGTARVWGQVQTGHAAPFSTGPRVWHPDHCVAGPEDD